MDKILIYRAVFHPHVLHFFGLKMLQTAKREVICDYFTVVLIELGESNGIELFRGLGTTVGDGTLLG
jgi:hypothetical protein